MAFTMARTWTRCRIFWPFSVEKNVTSVVVIFCGVFDGFTASAQTVCAARVCTMFTACVRVAVSLGSFLCFCTLLLACVKNSFLLFHLSLKALITVDFRISFRIKPRTRFCALIAASIFIVLTFFNAVVFTMASSCACSMVNLALLFRGIKGRSSWSWSVCSSWLWWFSLSSWWW